VLLLLLAMLLQMQWRLQRHCLLCLLQPSSSRVQQAARSQQQQQ
jgi:hypothetical protein